MEGTRQNHEEILKLATGKRKIGRYKMIVYSSLAIQSVYVQHGVLDCNWDGKYVMYVRE
jgi:hypothetical protein